jgi:hypothetical protein
VFFKGKGIAADQPALPLSELQRILQQTQMSGTSRLSDAGEGGLLSVVNSAGATPALPQSTPMTGQPPATGLPSTAPRLPADGKSLIKLANPGAANAPRLPNRAERPDLERELAALAQPERQSFLHDLISGLPVAIAFANGDYATGANLMARNFQRGRDVRDRRRELQLQGLKWRYEDWARQQAADLKAADPVTIGRSIVRVDPRTNQAGPIYTAPAEYQDYAAAQGHEPGTPEYFDAVEDYVLRGNGPAALRYDQQLDDHRTGNRQRLEGTRQGNRVTLEGIRQRNRANLRSQPSYRDLNPPASRSRTALPVIKTPEEAMRLPSGTQFRTPDGRVKVRP